MQYRILWSVAGVLVALAGLCHQRTGLEYVANAGQWHGNVLYRAGLGAGAVFLEEDRFTFSFIDQSDLELFHQFNRNPIAFGSSPSGRGHAWQMSFEGALSASVQGKNPASYYHNYFIGNDPSKWASNVKVFPMVEYTGLYEGVDLIVHQGSGNFKYDFKVQPGGTTEQIRLKFSGLNGLSLRDGSLILETSIGEFAENRPFAFQMVMGNVVEVPCRYELTGQTVSFVFPEGYDHNLELTIDPELIAATLSGSTSASNYGHTATFDMEGNIYTGCIAFGPGYPITQGAFQVFFANGGIAFGTDMGLSKLNPEGTDLIWATFIGGASNENPHSLWAGAFGELYIYGSTASSDFPSTPGAFDPTFNGETDIVVCKLNATGTQMIGSTFIGGAGPDGLNNAGINFGDAYRGEIIAGDDGKVLIASCSSSPDFPTTSGAFQGELAGSQDGVLCKLSANLSLMESATFIGGSGNDMAYGLRVDQDGRIFLAGMAGAADFPTTPGSWQPSFLGGAAAWGTNQMDGFIARFDSNASSLQKCTFIGTNQPDQVFFIDLDEEENVYVFGQGGSAMPVIGNVYTNPGSRQFVAKLDPSLHEILVSTVIGSGLSNEWSSGDFVPDAFLVDLCGNVYISAYQASNMLPTTPDAFYPQGGFYLAVLTENLAGLGYATYYTGNHVDGGTSRFDKNGTVYQAVCSGGGFATTPDAWAPGQITEWDIAVFKIDFDINGVNSAVAVPDLSGCAPYLCTFENFSTGDQFFWDFGDGSTSSAYEPLHTYLTPGVYEVMMIASDELSCNLADTSFFEISVSTPGDYPPSFDVFMDCSTLSVATTNTTGYDYLDYIWDMGDGTIIEADNALHTYDTPGNYVVSLQAVDNGCQSDSTIHQVVEVFNEVVAVLPQVDMEGCAPFSVNLNSPSPGALLTWDFGDGSPQVSGNGISHTYTLSGSHTITLYAEGTGACVGSDMATAQVSVIEPPPINADFTVGQTGECGLLLLAGENQSTGSDVSYFWSFGDGQTSTDEEISHTYQVPGEYTIVLTVEENLCQTQDQYSQVVQILQALPLGLPENEFICYYEDAVILQASDPGPGTSYVWSDGSVDSYLEVSDPGVYVVTASFNGCTYSHEIEVSTAPEMLYSATVQLCEGDNRILEIPVQSGSSYLWCGGQEGQSVSVVEPGDYCYSFIDENGCLQQGDFIVDIRDREPSLFIPNSFTPNQDGINDVFRVESTGLQEFGLVIWNRWGEQVFHSGDTSVPWDGSYKDRNYYLPDGCYIYSVSYRGECSSETIEKVGVVTMMR